MQVSDFHLPQSTSLPISKFQKVLDLKNLTMSYKPFWLWAIIYLIYEEKYKKDYSGNYSFDTKDIVKKMLSLAWVPVVSYRLNLGYRDQIGEIINTVSSSNPEIKTNWDYFRIEKEVEKYLAGNKSVYTKLLRFVPYRLLRPFYDSDLKNIKKKQVNNIIRELANNRPEIYSFEDDCIVMPDRWFNYLSVNFCIIESWVKYKLVHYLESRNPGIPAISLKLDLSVQRNLTSQRKSWIEFMKTEKVFDIISGNLVDSNNFHLDHYIPFSFLLHNQIWNLTPLEPANNLEKRDILPDWEKTFEIFSYNQYRFYSWAKKNTRKKVLDEYIIVLKDVREFNSEEFSLSLSGTLKPQWLAASGMGYSSTF